MIIEEGHYRENSPPKDTDVRLGIEIKNIESFDENSMSYQMKFLLSMGWNDNRLKFRNLKNESDFNRVRIFIKQKVTFE